MAYFTFGSTVVLLFEKDMIEVVQELKSGQELRLGEKLLLDWLISKKEFITVSKIYGQRCVMMKFPRWEYLFIREPSQDGSFTS